MSKIKDRGRAIFKLLIVKKAFYLDYVEYV